MNQTLKDIEIICIDDGSTDDSLDILKKFAKKDKRMTVIKQENLHSGVARNAGLAIAKGKYLSFLDSDDFFELNMLEKMYRKIEKMQSDIIICQCKALDLDTGLLDEQKLNWTLRLHLIPKKSPFSSEQISNNIFQISEGWAWDKLFRTEFILSNNLKFSNLINFNDAKFTYIALCLSKSISILKKKLIVKRHQNKKSLTNNKNKYPDCFLASFEKIKTFLDKKGLYNLFKESFWKWVIKLSIIHLKIYDNSSKEYIFRILHENFNIWDYIDNSSPLSNQYRALHYIKYQKVFPTINIAYAINRENFQLCLISVISVLKNSEFENINIILLYNDNNIVVRDLQKINELKIIHSFSLQILYISDEQIIDFPLPNLNSKEAILKFILANKFPNIDKMLYLDCSTIILKTLLPLWEINIESKLIGAVEDISFSKEKAKKLNLKDNFFFNSKVLLLNLYEWRKSKLFEKLVNYFKFNQVKDSYDNALNLLTDMKKISLNPEFNYMKILSYNNSQYNGTYLDLYKRSNPTIINYIYTDLNISNINSSFTNEFLKYNNLLKEIKKNHLTIPIVLSSDDKYEPYMYITMMSILENARKNTFYEFARKGENIVVNNNHDILQLKHNIFFVVFEYITLTTYYRLLIGDLLPKDLEKCIYLDVDECVCKDLSELFNTDLKNDYIAGVVSPVYYFNQKLHCKRLNIPTTKNYINAGMMIINLKLIRQDNMTQKFIELSKRNYSSQDQDVLNVACFGKIKTLPPKYNVQVMRLYGNNPRLKELYKEQDILEAISSPYIIHYSNKHKPWNSLGVFLENYWWDMVKKTPFINLFSRINLYKNELKKWWYLKTNKELNLEKPSTFEEKIQWLKIFDSIPIKTHLSDKYLSREWAKEKIGEEYIVPLYAFYDNFERIDFESLPNQFVMKCNHGRGYNIIVKDKTQLNITEAKIRIDKWMNENFAFKNGLELQYRDIPHKILIEKYLIGELRFYEFWCFRGKPKYIWINSDNHKFQNSILFDLNWNLLSNKSNSNNIIVTEKPNCLGQMIKLSCLLSENFIFVGVNFYVVNDKIYFRKMSFTSLDGKEDLIPPKINKKLASLIRFQKFVYDIDKGEYYKLNKSFSIYPFYIVLIALFFKLLCNLWNLLKILFFYN